MSFNISTRLNNLQQQVNNIANTGLTNPLEQTLNANNYNIINANQITAAPSSTLTLGGASVQINAPVVLPNHPLTITNSTNNDSLIVTDQAGDTNVFRIDAYGNVGILQSPSITLPTGLSVGGNITCGNVIASNVVNSLTAGNPSIQMGGTQSNRTISLNSAIQIDQAQSNNNNAEINFNTPTTPGWNNNSLIIKAKNQTSNYTAIFNTATGSTNLPQVNTDTIASITGGEINVNNNLDLGANSLTCGTLNYTTLNPPITDAGGTVTSLSIANNSATIATPTTTPAIRNNCIGTAYFQFDGTFPPPALVAQTLLLTPVSPGQSITAWYFAAGTSPTGMAFNVLNNWSSQNYVCVISCAPSIMVSGPIVAGTDYISANMMTDAGGAAGGSDGAYFYDITAVVSPNFNIVTDTQALSNASNTRLGLRLTNNTGSATINWAMIPGTIRVDVYDRQFF